MRTGLRPRLVIAAVAVIALAACGAGDDGESAAAGDDQDLVEDGDGTTVDDAADDADDDPTADGADVAGDDAGDDGDAGPGEHRPGADVVIDEVCAEVGDDAPGAEILFPDDASQDAGPSPATVEVAGCSNTFESNLEYEAYHGQDSTPTLEGHTMGGSMGEWRPFSIEETYWTVGTWRVVVFEHDAESGERNDYDEVTFEVSQG